MPGRMKSLMLHSKNEHQRFQEMRVSMVARNSDGERLWWSKRSIVGCPTPVDGEALAFHHGLQIAHHHGWRKIIAESDCLQLISKLSRSSRSLASYGAILDSCYVLKDFFHDVNFQFIRRSGNVLAHRIATNWVIPCSEGLSLLPELDCNYE